MASRLRSSASGRAQHVGSRHKISSCWMAGRRDTGSGTGRTLLPLRCRMHLVPRDHSASSIADPAFGPINALNTRLGVAPACASPCARDVRVGRPPHLQPRRSKRRRSVLAGLFRLAHAALPPGEAPRPPPHPEAAPSGAPGARRLHAGGGPRLRSFLRLGDDGGGCQGARPLFCGR